MPEPSSEPRTSMRVVWTRGNGCQELAQAIGGSSVKRVTGDVGRAVVDQRADLVVARRISTKLRTSMAIPVDFELTRFDRVVAAVSGGPHSSLATEVAHAIGQTLDIPSRLVSAYRDSSERPDAVATLYRLNEVAPDIEGDVVEASTPADLLLRVGERALLVLGAPGGAWVQRMFFGAGARMISAAPAGAVVVRRGTRRAYQVMQEPVYVSPMLGTDDALRLSDADILPVVDHGRLVGVVRRAALHMAGEGVTVGALMRSPEAVKASDGVLIAGDIAARQGGGPVAVVDDDGHLIGTVPLTAIRSGLGY
jgi:hypothetical protein